jgi:hypothetical protein
MPIANDVPGTPERRLDPRDGPPCVAAALEKLREAARALERAGYRDEARSSAVSPQVSSMSPAAGTPESGSAIRRALLVEMFRDEIFPGAPSPPGL